MSGLSIAPYFPFAGVKVVSQALHGSDPRRGLISLEPDLRYCPRCHVCGGRCRTVHSKGHHRIVWDLPMANTRILLQVSYRKVWCGHCSRAKVERLSFCEAGKRVTHRLSRYIYDLCKVLPVAAVARHFDLDPKTVAAIDHRYLEEELGRTDYGDLQILAVDEIRFGKYHGYMTVVPDYVSGRVVWMGEGRRARTLDRFFEGMTDWQKSQIEAVAMDMWDPYVKSVRCHCPMATIVFDLFHVVANFGRVIDAVRRSEYHKARCEDRPIFRGTRYLLLKNAENLKDSEQSRLADLLNLNAKLNAVYVLKDQLKEIYRYGDRQRACRALGAWRHMAKEVDHPRMTRFLKMLQIYEYGILNHCDYPISTSVLEGVNNKIKVIKRRAYGYHDPNYFALKVKCSFTPKPRSNFFG